MLTDNVLLKKAKRLNVPNYVTADHIKAILSIIDKGLQHPDKPACDTTIEIAVGISPGKAISHLYNKRDGSVYQQLYDTVSNVTHVNAS